MARRQRIPSPQPVEEPEWLDEGERLAMEEDPVQTMRHLRTTYRSTGGDARARMIVGLGGEAPDGRPYARFVATRSEAHLLALGPPRSHAGKTASMMIPIVVSQIGPVVTASTKPDILNATAMARAQHGRLWCYSPDGDTEQLPPGVRELRWSPVSGAKEWRTALTTAKEMVATLDVSDVRGGGHWKSRASNLLAPVLHWAALTGGTMRDARDSVYEINTPTGDGGEPQGQLIWRSLAKHGRSGDATAAGGRDAAMMLSSVLHTAHEERASIASTAARALEGYELPDAMRSTENPNFDVEDFVRGGEDGIRADTVYITASSKNQEHVAPLVVALLGQIRAAVYRHHRTHPGMPMVTFALDELYGLAPLPDLPHMLSDAGSQGLLIAAAVQDLTLTRSRWPKEADSFLTLFQHVVIYPGIRDTRTLEAVSKLVGNWDKAKETTSQTGYQHGWSTTTERVPILDPSAISQGVEPTNLDILLHLSSGGYGLLRSLPYFRAAPWPHILTRYLEMALSGQVPEWVWKQAARSGEQTPGEDVLAGLPVPDLTKWALASVGDPSARPCDARWAPRYVVALRRAEAARRAPLH